MPKKPLKANKSAFIRSLPSNMPATEVVAKAKAANMNVSPGFVYAIRSKSRNRKGAPKGAKRGRKAASGKPTASEFVRSQPASLKASEIVAAGAKAGLKFSTNLVYAVRSSRMRSTGRKGRATAQSTATTGTAEATLRRAALDLGIGRARQILDDLESKLRALIGAE